MNQKLIDAAQAVLDRWKMKDATNIEPILEDPMRELAAALEEAKTTGLIVFDSDNGVQIMDTNGKEVPVAHTVDYNNLHDGTCPVCGETEMDFSEGPCPTCGYDDQIDGDNALECAIKMVRREGK